MTDSDPVVRARELAAVQDQEYDALDWMIEATLLLPVLCDIIDELRTKVENSERDTAEIFEHNTTLYTQKRALEELNVRLIHALRSVLDGISEIGGGSKNFASELARWSDLGRIEGEARDLLAELSVTPETQ